MADFGHGFFENKIYKLIKRKSKILSINTQTNSDNRGFNFITKYSGADIICLDRPEIQLALSNKNSTLEHLSLLLEKRVKFKNLIITLGHEGIFVKKKSKQQKQKKMSS